MMSKSGGDIDLRIRVVDGMKAPKDIDTVQEPVLRIGKGIQTHYRNDDPHPARQSKRIEETGLLEFREDGCRERGDRR